MDLAWIAITIFAALMQAVRTAAQKSLNAHLSTLATTYVRALFGLPLLVGYLLIVEGAASEPIPLLPAPFWIFALATALTQIAATWLLIHLFTLKNFAVATVLPKSDVVMTAVIGSLFFSERLTGLGWLGVVLASFGIVLLSGPRARTKGAAPPPATASPNSAMSPVQVGLATAFGFTLSYLFLREAGLSLAISPVRAAAWTVVAVTALQTLLVGAWFAVRARHEFAGIMAHARAATFIGVTSALGSIGWFTAMTLQNASYVKAVGQVEAVFALAISSLYFRESTTWRELCGIVTVVACVLVFLL